MGTRGICDFL